MSKIHRIGSALDYIARLDIPEADPQMPRLQRPEAAIFQDDTEGAAVDAGSLVSFVAGLTALHKSDVLNSTLLAQLAATKQYNRFTQTKLWYDKYIEVLANVGWVVPAFAYRDYSPSGDSLVVSDAVLDILAAIATGNEMAILATSLNALKSDTNDKQLVLFDSQSFPENVGTFQIFPVGEDDGQVVMVLSAMQFNSEKHVNKFLWFTWTKTTVRLVQSSQKAVLNEDVYGKVRQAVIDKLGGNAEKYIADIEI